MCETKRFYNIRNKNVHIFRLFVVSGSQSVVCAVDICNDPGHYRRRRARSIPVRTGHGKYAHKSFIYDNLDCNTLRADRKNKRQVRFMFETRLCNSFTRTPYYLNNTAGNIGETFTLNVHTYASDPLPLNYYSRSVRETSKQLGKHPLVVKFNFVSRYNKKVRAGC